MVKRTESYYDYEDLGNSEVYATCMPYSSTELRLLPPSRPRVVPQAPEQPRDFLAEAEAELAHLDEYLEIQELPAPRHRGDAWRAYLGRGVLVLLVVTSPFVLNWLVQ